MGQPRTEIDAAAQAFILAQKMFFVASAPLSASGRINLSPKGLDTFRILSPKTVGYLDFTGSGIETIAHIRENQRLTIMFCSFEDSPNILRIYGTGRSVEPAEPDFAPLRDQFPGAQSARAIILLDVARVTDSCGFGVPLYEFRGHRDQIEAWAQRKGPEGIAEYQRNKNAASLDGLPGLKSVSGQIPTP